MAKKAFKPDRLRADILAQRANLITSEAQVAAEINAAVAKLIKSWRAKIKKVLGSGGTASEVADAARYSKVLRELGQETDATVAAVEKIARKIYAQTLQEESARFVHKFDKAGIKSNVAMAAKLDMIAKKQLASAASYSELPLNAFRSFQSMSAAAKKRLQQDVVKAIAEGQSGTQLGKKWAAGAGAGRLAKDADAMARTAMMAASNQAMVAEATASGGSIKALKWNATFDLRTCPTCAGLHGKVFSLTALPPMPVHPRCRCVWEPVFADASLNTVLEQVRPYPKPSPASILGQSRDFDKWLRGQPVGQQLDFFGSRIKQRAWATKALRLDQLSSAAGRVLSDKDILAKLGKAQAKTVSYGTPLAKSLPPTVQAAPDVSAAGSSSVPSSIASSGEWSSTREKLLAETQADYEAFLAADADRDSHALKLSGDYGPVTEADFLEHEGKVAKVIRLQEALSRRGRAFLRAADPAAPFAMTDAFGDVVTVAKDAKAIEAESFLRSVLSKEAVPGVKLQIKKLPNGSRDFYAGRGVINMSRDANIQTYIHEMAHAIEAQSGWVSESRNFVLSRSKGESLKKLSDIYPNSGFGPDEVAFQDKFRNAYTGRWYAKTEATEVVSVGLQWMYEDAIGFAKDDPQYFDFITKLMRGGAKRVKVVEGVVGRLEAVLAPATFDVLGKAKQVLAGQIDIKTANQGLTDEQAKQLKYKLHNIKQLAKKAGIDPLAKAEQMKNTFLGQTINLPPVPTMTTAEIAAKEGQDLAAKIAAQNAQIQAEAADKFAAAKAAEIKAAVEKLDALADGKHGYQNQFFDVEKKSQFVAVKDTYHLASTSLPETTQGVPLSKVVTSQLATEVSDTKYHIDQFVKKGEFNYEPLFLKHDGMYYLYTDNSAEMVSAADFLGAKTIKGKVVDLDAYAAKLAAEKEQLAIDLKAADAKQAALDKQLGEAAAAAKPVFLDALGYAKQVLEGVGDVATVAKGLPKEAIAEIKQKLRIIRRKAKKEGITQLEAAAKMKHGKPFTIGTTPVPTVTTPPVVPGGMVPKALIAEQPKVDLPTVGSKFPDAFPPAAIKGLEGIEAGSVIDGSAMTKYAEQKGSNPGGFFKDQAGTKWYLKTPKEYEMARNEVLANKLYRAAGVSVPDIELANINGQTGVASRVLDLKSATATEMAKAKGTLDGFAVDAWLANWDVVGLGYDNILIDSAGNAVRVDTGGALRYRAKAGLKGSLFTDTVGELETFLSGKNPQASSVFKDISEQQIIQSINKVAAVSPIEIERLVNIYGPVEQSEREKLINRLLIRRKFLVERRDKMVYDLNHPPAPRVGFVAPGSKVKYKSLDEATDAEVRAIKWWVSSAGNSSLYQYFENPLPWREKQLLDTYGSKAKIEEALKANDSKLEAMAAVIQKLPTVKKPADFARGIRVSAEFMEKYVQKWIDDEVLPIEFTQSVSRSTYTAENFGNLIFKFQNTDKMLDLYQVRQDSSVAISHLQEQEVFAVKGTKFKITKVVKEGHKTILYLEDMP